ncbi:MAG TPA: hypothetical protein VLA89_06540 [Gemmatimonadales bacterium]|nr:hypothetical protein [Gemmatimonadales bacterium]
MGAYRCSVCNLSYQFPKPCEVCGGGIWWSPNSSPSTEEDKKVVRRALANDEWKEDVDKAINWRFEQLLLAGYDLARAEELAKNRRVNLREACDRAVVHGAEAAFLKFY